VARLRRKSFDPSATLREANDLFGAWDALWQGAWHRPAKGAFLNVAFDILTLYFLFVAAGDNISLGVLLAGYGLPLLLGKLAFVIPGGVGVVESSMAVLYNNLGVPQATTVVVVLSYRLISFWIPSLAGFPIAAYLQRSQSDSPKKHEVHTPTM
jgi:glycosyltransferase 2 family protein